MASNDITKKWCTWRCCFHFSAPLKSAKTRMGANPKSTRRKTICDGEMRTLAQRMNKKLVPQIKPNRPKATLAGFISNLQERHNWDEFWALDSPRTTEINFCMQ
ncbi:hypothetical protein PT2222_490029 [Paraburkholderia tropica]